MKRITILGPSGSGKSTLAVKLGKILGLPVYHIDCFVLDIDESGTWIVKDKKLVAEQINEIAATKKWIIDGTNRRTLANRFEKSDLIVFLNLPLEDCIEICKQRSATKEKRIGIPEFMDYETENVAGLIAKNIENWTGENRRNLEALLEKYKSKVTELKSRKQIDDFVATMCP